MISPLSDNNSLLYLSIIPKSAKPYPLHLTGDKELYMQHSVAYTNTLYLQMQRLFTLTGFSILQMQRRFTSPDFLVLYVQKYNACIGEHTLQTHQK